MEKQFAARLAAAFAPASRRPTAEAMTPFEARRAHDAAGSAGAVGPPVIRRCARSRAARALMLMMKAVFRPSRREPSSRRGTRGDRRGAGRRSDDRVDDAARRGRAFGCGTPARTGDHSHAAHALEHPRAQRRDGRGEPGARRSAYGPAAGAHRARRTGRRRRPFGFAYDPGRRAVRRLFRDRAGARRANQRPDRADAGGQVFGLSQVHDPRGPRLAGARGCGVARARAPPCARRAS